MTSAQAKGGEPDAVKRPHTRIKDAATVEAIGPVISGGSVVFGIIFTPKY
jgi:hypothetical protein